MKVPILDLKAQYAPIRSEIKAAMDTVLEHGIYILGPETRDLEKNIREYCHANHALATSNGTDSLLLSMLAIGIEPGDEVMTSSFSFFATAETISFLRAKPVFVDIDPQTFCLDPKKLETAVTKKTRAIIPVHIFGQCADMDPILEIAKQKNLCVIEDACQAIGAEYKERKACSMGDFAVLSFYPSKNLGTYGEGGMLLVKNEEHFVVARECRTHGEFPKSYQHKRIGMNARIGAFEAAVLNVKFKYLNQWNQKRREAAQTYYRLFEEAGLLKKVGIPKIGPGNLHVFHLYAILTSHKQELQEFLQQEGIQTGNHFPLPLPFLHCYKNLGYKAGDFPVSEEICSQSLALPIYPEITLEQQEYVVSKIEAFFKRKL